MQTAKTDPEATHVYCYSGSTYAEAPRALDWEGKHHIVSRIETSWRTPEGPAFQVQTKPGNRFVLRYHEARDQWIIKQLPEGLAPREAQASPIECRPGKQSLGQGGPEQS